MKRQFNLKLLALLLSILMLLSAVLTGCSTSDVVDGDNEQTGDQNGDNGNNGNGDGNTPYVEKNGYNVAVRSVYTPVVDTIIRIDYNADGDHLGFVFLDEETLTPLYDSIKEQKTFVYDEEGRLELVVFESIPIYITAAEDGRSASGSYALRGANVSVEIEYDSEGRLTKDYYYTVRGTEKVLYLGFEYNTDGNVKKCVYNDNRYVAEYTRVRNEVTVKEDKISVSANTGTGETTQTLVTKYKYVTYSEDGRITKYLDNERDGYEYTYDAASNKMSCTEDGELAAAVTYDSEGRPIKAEHFLDNPSYNASTTFTYNAEGDILTSQYKKTYTSDGYNNTEDRKVEFKYFNGGALDGIEYTYLGTDSYSGDGRTQNTTRYCKFNSNNILLEEEYTSDGWSEGALKGKVEEKTLYSETYMPIEDTETITTQDGKLIEKTKKVYTLNENGDYAKCEATVEYYYTDGSVIVDYMTKKETTVTEYAEGKSAKTTTTVETFDANGNVTSTNTTTDTQ